MKNSAALGYVAADVIGRPDIESYVNLFSNLPQALCQILPKL